MTSYKREAMAQIGALVNVIREWQSTVTRFSLSDLIKTFLSMMMPETRNIVRVTGDP